jgi:hypothetical protein
VFCLGGIPLTALASAIKIKTADGWVSIGDTQTISPPEYAGEKLIRDNMFCGWSPMPMGITSNQNAQVFSEKMHKAGSLVDVGCDLHSAWQTAGEIITQAHTVTRLARQHMTVQSAVA